MPTTIRLVPEMIPREACYPPSGMGEVVDADS